MSNHLYVLQKQQLLQVPEQRRALENEVAIHRAVHSDSVLQLVDSQVVERAGGDSTAYLLFPYYQVCVALHLHGPFSLVDGVHRLSLGGGGRNHFHFHTTDSPPQPLIGKE